MKLLILVLSCLLLIAARNEETQRGNEPVPDLQGLCFDAIQHSPRLAPDVCRRYLEQSAVHDQRRARFVRQWLVAYDKVQPYIRALAALNQDPDSPLLVYEPDLKLEIPQVVEKDGNYPAEVQGSFNGPMEDALLRKAEAVYQSPNKMS